MVIESSCCYVSLLYLQLNPCASVLSTYPMFPGEYAPCVAVENDDIKVRTSIESTSQSFELTSYRQIRLLSSPVPAYLHSRLSKLLVMNVPQAYRLCPNLSHLARPFTILTGRDVANSFRVSKVLAMLL